VGVVHVGRVLGDAQVVDPQAEAFGGIDVADVRVLAGGDVGLAVPEHRRLHLVVQQGLLGRVGIKNAHAGHERHEQFAGLGHLGRSVSFRE
jgi:hypothetical protein